VSFLKIAFFEVQDWEQPFLEKGLANYEIRLFKEELNEIWEQEDQETAEALLMDWITFAESTGIRMLHDFARTLRFHASGILAYYDHPISTGPLEGTNNKIKTMKRQAYGFRDQEFFRLKILGIHESKYALVG
jgi:transposase